MCSVTGVGERLHKIVGHIGSKLWFPLQQKKGNFSCQKLKHVIELNHLHQVINKQTRITAHSETVIDHVNITTPENAADIFVPSIAVSDHYPTCFTSIISKKKRKKKKKKKNPSKDMIINVYNIFPTLFLMKIHF